MVIVFSEKAKSLSLTITLFRRMSHALNPVSRQNCPSTGSIASRINLTHVLSQLTLISKRS